MSGRRSLSTRVCVPVIGGVAAGALLATANAGAVPGTQADHAAHGPVGAAFDSAAERYDVPRDLLVAIGYGESRLTDHEGAPSQANGYGIMHLTSNVEHRTLDEARELTGDSRADLKGDVSANIHGAAAVLRHYADALGLAAADRQDVNAWYEAVAEYSGATEDRTASVYADAVYEFLEEGVTATSEGERLTVAAQEVAPERGAYADVRDQPASGYPGAIWNPAHSSNYVSGRGAAIDSIVVHTTEGQYAGAISWFQNPASNVSAHYVIRSADGEVTQMVRDADTAWHAGNYNARSIGIEHEAFIAEPEWYTDTMYRSSADLVKHLSDAHGIPLNRDAIVAHSEIGASADPGPHWDWDYYMDLVTS